MSHLAHNPPPDFEAHPETEAALREHRLYLAIADIVAHAEDKSEAAAVICHAAYGEGIPFGLLSCVAADLNAEPENHVRATP